MAKLKEIIKHKPDKVGKKQLKSMDKITDWIGARKK